MGRIQRFSRRITSIIILTVVVGLFSCQTNRGELKLSERDINELKRQELNKNAAESFSESRVNTASKKRHSRGSTQDEWFQIKKWDGTNCGWVIRTEFRDKIYEIPVRLVEFNHSTEGLEDLKGLPFKVQVQDLISTRVDPFYLENYYFKAKGRLEKDGETLDNLVRHIIYTAGKDSSDDCIGLYVSDWKIDRIIDREHSSLGSFKIENGLKDLNEEEMAGLLVKWRRDLIQNQATNTRLDELIQELDEQKHPDLSAFVDKLLELKKGEKTFDPKEDPYYELFHKAKEVRKPIDPTKLEIIGSELEMNGLMLQKDKRIQESTHPITVDLLSIQEKTKRH